jgi:hypothetical protein
MTSIVQDAGIRPHRDAGRLSTQDERELLTHQAHQESAQLADGLQPVLSIRGRVEGPDVPAFVRDALGEIRTYIEEHHVQIEGPPFSIRHAAPRHGVEVEVGWPVGRTHGSGRIACRTLPAALIHRGPDHS